jgi:hypothetical protein
LIRTFIAGQEEAIESLVSENRKNIENVQQEFLVIHKYLQKISRQERKKMLWEKVYMLSFSFLFKILKKLLLLRLFSLVTS